MHYWLRLLLVPMLLSLGLTAPVRADPPDSFSFNGVWQGRIKFDKEAYISPSSTPADGQLFRIEIRDGAVVVRALTNGNFDEIKPGAFQFVPYKASAVIFAIDSGEPDHGVYWVETWVFTVTLKDSNTLLVEYARMVNNVGAPPEQDGSKFATRGIGEFKRDLTAAPLPPPPAAARTPKEGEI